MPNQHTPKRQAIIPIGPSIAYIPLTKEKYAVVDSHIANEICRFNWYFKSPYYARRTGEGGQILWMHYEILPMKEGLECDHINGDGLLNIRGNLRYATRSQNNMNRKLNRNSRSGFKGVWKVGDKWWAAIKIDGELISLGYHEKMENAITARKDKECELFGQYSRGLVATPQ
jgi:hypothetical protein